MLCEGARGREQALYEGVSGEGDRQIDRGTEGQTDR